MNCRGKHHQLVNLLHMCRSLSNVCVYYKLKLSAVKSFVQNIEISSFTYYFFMKKHRKQN